MCRHVYRTAAGSYCFFCRVKNEFTLFVVLFPDSDKSHQWQEPKFATECFFLAAQCHHLSVVPVMHKYQRILRAVRELKHMIDEFDKADASAVDQHRKKIVLDRWRSQLGVSIHSM
jgi:Ubiquitin elongating factor core